MDCGRGKPQQRGGDRRVTTLSASISSTIICSPVDDFPDGEVSNAADVLKVTGTTTSIECSINGCE